MKPHTLQLLLVLVVQEARAFGLWFIERPFLELPHWIHSYLVILLLSSSFRLFRSSHPTEYTTLAVNLANATQSFIIYRWLRRVPDGLTEFAIRVALSLTTAILLFLFRHSTTLLLALTPSEDEISLKRQLEGNIGDRFRLATLEAEYRPESRVSQNSTFNGSRIYEEDAEDFYQDEPEDWEPMSEYESYSYRIPPEPEFIFAGMATGGSSKNSGPSDQNGKKIVRSLRPRKNEDTIFLLKKEHEVGVYCAHARPLEYNQKRIFFAGLYFKKTDTIVQWQKQMNEHFGDIGAKSIVLYRGVNSVYLEGQLADMSYPSTLLNALGSGVYTTTSFELAMDYATKNGGGSGKKVGRGQGGIMVFRGLSEKVRGLDAKIVDYRNNLSVWRNIVRGNLHASTPAFFRVSQQHKEEYLNATILIAPIVGNFDDITNFGKEPLERPDEAVEYVIRCPELLKKHLWAVVECRPEPR